MRFSILLAFISLIVMSCQKESLESSYSTTADTPAIREYADVDEELWFYFQRFELEAAARGINIDLNQAGIIGVIDEIEESNVAGRCNYHSQFPNLVTIDNRFWRNSNTEYREAVVFHELGHCHLLRDHREAQNNQGQCLSLMASGVGSCILAYSPQTRNTYLDELFDSRFAGDWFN